MSKDQIKNKNKDKGIGTFFRSLLQSLSPRKKSAPALPDDISAPAVIHEKELASQTLIVKKIKSEEVVLSPELSAQQHYQRGVDCFRHGVDDDGDIRAFRHFQKAAELGHAEAQAYLAYMYQMGYATPKNPQKAFQWGLAAAQKNMAEAQFNVALCYLNGWGVSVNLEQAIYWLEAAAEKGITDAQRYLGNIYSGDKSLHQNVESYLDFDLAERYYLDAIHANDLEAQLQLAKIYLSEECGKKNIPRAKQLLEICAQAGFDDALYLLGMQYLAPEQGDPDYQQASALLYQAAQNKNPDAMYELGCLYAQGRGVEHNKDLSKRYWELAATAAHKKAKQKLYEDFDIFVDETPCQQKERTSVVVKLI